MADNSAIGWTDATWTIVTGCDVVSPACGFCYARAFAPRLQKMERARRADPDVPEPNEKYQTDSDRKSSGVGFEVVCHEHLLDWPLKLKRGRKIFVTSMGDLFHERVPWPFIARVFAVMSIAEQHTFQVLTKRPERAQAVLSYPMFWLALNAERMHRGFAVLPGGSDDWAAGANVLPNVWMGTTIENRAFVDRAQVLRETPAVARFISAEPLLGPLVQPQTGPRLARGHHRGTRYPAPGRALDLRGIDWVIAGGESGQHLKKAPHRFLVDTNGVPRQDRADWLRDLRDASAANGVAFFFKQWGGRTTNAGGRVLDGREWSEFPEPMAAAA